MRLLCVTASCLAAGKVRRLASPGFQLIHSERHCYESAPFYEAALCDSPPPCCLPSEGPSEEPIELNCELVNHSINLDYITVFPHANPTAVVAFHTMGRDGCQLLEAQMMIWMWDVCTLQVTRHWGGQTNTSKSGSQQSSSQDI